MLMSCDRCHNDFEGFKAKGGPELKDMITAGYYDLSGDDKIDYSWAKFRQHPDEKVVCDECMFKDPKYIEIYGRHNVNADS